MCQAAHDLRLAHEDHFRAEGLSLGDRKALPASVLDEVLLRSNGGRPLALAARSVLMHQRTLPYICCS